MSNINKAAVLNPFSDLTSNILNYVPRATTSEFGIVAIGSGINVDALGRIYLDTQEYSDRLTAIEAQAASSLTTQQTEVAAAIAQVNLAQSQTITTLTLEVNNLKTNLTNSITATKTELIDRADQLARNVSSITDQLAQDKAAFTQEIQDALVYLENEASVASALRTPRKIQGVDFDGTQDISLPVFSTQTDGLVPKRVGATSTKYLCEDGTWVIPTNTTYALLTKAVAEVGTATTANTISAQVLKDAIKFHAPPVTDITGNAGTATKLAIARTITLSGAATGTATSFDGSANISIEVTSLDAAKLSGTASIPTTGNAGTATKLQTPRTVGGVSFDGTTNINLPGVNAAGNQNTSGNAATATKLANARTISLTGGVTGSVSFDGSANASIATTVTGLGVANGIATLDSSGQVQSTQLPSYVDDVLEYANVAAFPTTGVAGKIYVETTGNTTYRWSGTAYVKITSGEVSSVAGKTGVVTLTKSDVGLSNVDNTSDSTKNVASAAKLTTARTINGVAFDGTQNISLPVPEAYSLPTASASVLGGIKVGTGLSISNSILSVGTLNQDTTGNATTATKLATARSINGTSFDGTTDITTTNWGTARTLTIGSTGKSINGSANISWTLAEIDAAAASHTHAYLPTSGGTLSGNLNVTGAITATGNITAFSDARLKDNITKIPDALNKLNQLKGVTYTRKDLASDKQYAGLIAQDVQKVLPEAVAVTEDDIIAVDYNGVIGLLVEAIKELESKVAKLEDK